MSSAFQISTAVVLILISLSVFLIFSDFRSRFQLPAFYLPTSSCTATRHHSTAPRPPPLKVFMYDLPPRFNFDMLGHAAVGGIPSWPETSGLKKQHSVEYWLTVSLMAGNNGSGQGEDGIEAVRVLDGDEAEVYFVPFFSSLSFNTHGRMMTDPETEVDRQLQICEHSSKDQVVKLVF